MGELYLCATPLGNLGDITLRALELLKQVDLIAAEDTRRTRKLLSHFQIHTPTTSYYEHNRQAKAPLLLEELAAGKKIALVTDAGTPGIADPGYQLVQQALAQGHQVVVVPGPSAAIAALVVSGIRPHPFYFQGFLPRRAGERRALLTELAEEARTGVFYEAPHRLQKTLRDFCELWGPHRQVAIARELTKQFEEVVRGSFGEVAARFAAAPPLGELTIVTAGVGEASEAGGHDDAAAASVEPADEGKAPEHGAATPRGRLTRPPAAGAERGIDGGRPIGGHPAGPEQIKQAVGALVDAGADTQSACKAVARALGLAKSQVYRLYHS